MRSYVDADLPALQSALAAWTEEAGPCGYCHVGEVAHRIYETLHGRTIGEVVQVWEDDAAVMGFAITTKFDRAFDVFASSAVRGTSAEIAMLEAASATTLAFVNAAALEPPSVITDVFDGDDLRRDLLTGLGFERYRLWDYVVEFDLATPQPAPRVPDGFTVRSAMLDDAAGLAAIRNDGFGGDWTADSYRSGVLEKPDCPPAREIVVAAPDGSVSRARRCSKA